MATFYIQLQDKLLQISGELTAENISKALGYVPVGSSTLNNYATKEEVSDLVDISFNDINDNPFFSDGSGEFNIVDETGNVIAKIDKDGLHSVDFIAGEHILSEKADKKDIPSLKGYATEKFVTDKIAEAELGGEEIDLSEYAKKTDLEGLATEQWVEDQNYLTEHQDISHLATKDEIPSLEGYAKLDDIPEVPSLDGYATESWVEGQNYAKKNEIPSADFNSLENNPLAEDESGELNMTDESGNVGFKLNEQGLFVKDVIAGEHVLSNKIDKVDGKQLSTEDFTAILKNKLEGLSNYDDTELSNALSTLRGDFDALVSGDTTTAIKTFNEVIAFLDNISDTEDLAGIIGSIEQQLMWTKAEGEAGVRLKGTNGTATGNLAISAGDDKKASDGTQFTSAASGDHAVVFGYGNTCAGRSTLAQGLYNTVNGKDSVAFGQRNLVNGDQAFAAGQQNEVTTRLGVAIGYKNKATNTDSIAIGYQNTSGGSASVAMGDTCEANGTSSTAMGYKTKATGAYSSTFGQNTQATNSGEVAMGLYNKSTTSTDTSEQTSFSFGIGTSDTNRANALEIKKNGDVYLGDKKLSDFVTSQYVDEVFQSAIPAEIFYGSVYAHANGIADDQFAYVLPSSANGDEDDIIATRNSLKTINGESLVGSGDITISGGATLTEADIAAMGFTKNTGTYSKPSGGIPKSDLASEVQTSLGKADTALQSYTEQYKGTITGVSANGTSVATSGVANIPAASTSKYGVTKLSSATNSTSTTLAATASAVKSAYDLANGKQDKLVSGTNIKTINGTSILGSGNITISGGEGGTSGGGKEFVEIEPDFSPAGYEGFISLAQMNKIYVSDKPLIIMGVAELENGIEGEVSIHFVADALGCTLSLPEGVIWADGKIPDSTLTDCYCELSIVAVKNINTYIYKAVLSTIPYGHNVVLQAGDNGQIGIDTYNYMVNHGVTDSVGTIDWTATIEDNIFLNADGLVNQRLKGASISPGEPDRWFSLYWPSQGWWVAYLQPDGYLNIEYDD